MSAGERWMTVDHIACLLRFGQVQFVVADVGLPFLWIPLGNCYDFWKREVQPHLVAPESKVSLDDYPGGYCYLASEWSNRDGAPTIVCERHH
jgi:hypothetical protein